MELSINGIRGSFTPELQCVIFSARSEREWAHRSRFAYAKEMSTGVFVLSTHLWVLSGILCANHDLRKLGRGKQWEMWAQIVKNAVTFARRWPSEKGVLSVLNVLVFFLLRKQCSGRGSGKNVVERWKITIMTGEKWLVIRLLCLWDARLASPH